MCCCIACPPGDRGGKLQALEYVRTLYGIPRSRCVAAGDSGNDILMLGGTNPAVVVGNAQQELLDWVLRQVGRGARGECPRRPLRLAC